MEDVQSSYPTLLFSLEEVLHGLERSWMTSSIVILFV